MGIHGLTTFLRENKRALSTTLNFPLESDVATPLVVDAWSFIYKVLHDSNIPWVYGGEYDQLVSYIHRVLDAWVSLKIRPIFVFDGSSPIEKFSTKVSRKNRLYIQPSLLFFRTSSVSRNSRRFLNETRIRPPLAYQACVHALYTFRYKAGPYASASEADDEESLSEVGDTMLEVHFADEEGDPYAVELAGRLDGYVTGSDSDFVVLNSDGYRGYLPLDELIWVALNAEDSKSVDDVDDGFQAVKSKKKAVVDRSIGRGIIPPESENFSLSATLYTPASLAKFLNIPVSLLPLLGALVGNDYTRQAADQTSSTSQTSARSFQTLLYERQLICSQRIIHTGTVLRSFLFPPPGKRKQLTPHSVMELIQMTVNLLMTTSGAPATLIGSTQQAEIVEKIVEGTLPYAIPVAPSDLSLLNNTVCSLHLPDECRLVNIIDRMAVEASPNYAVEVAIRYLTAYRRGDFSHLLMNILCTRSFWPEIFLENPDLETVSKSISRGVREFGYSILEDGIILPAPEEPEEDEIYDEDPDEVIDVVESSDDDYEDEDNVSENVGRLRGALRDLQFEQKEYSMTDDSFENQSSLEEGDMYTSASTVSSDVRSPVPLPRPLRATSSVNRKKKTVIEYIRRGTRLVEEEVEVPCLHTLLPMAMEKDPIPLQLRDESERMGALCTFLRTDPQTILALPKSERIAVLVLRLVLQRLHARAEENLESKAKQHEKWTRNEARAFLACIEPSNLVDAPSEVSERAVQQTAQILTAFEAIEHIVHILLLSDAMPSCVHRFSGMRFHGWLAASTSDAAKSPPVDENIWHAVEVGLEACFTDVKKDKKVRKKEKGKSGASVPTTSKKPGGSGLYSMLDDMSL